MSTTVPEKESVQQPKAINKAWSPEEDKILLRYFLAEGIKVALRLPGRTEKACLVRAQKLGLRKKSLWSKEEDDILREGYSTMGIAVQSKLPGRSVRAIMGRAATLGLRSETVNRWTIDEDLFVLANMAAGPDFFAENPLSSHTVTAVLKRASIFRTSGLARVPVTRRETDVFLKFHPDYVVTPENLAEVENSWYEIETF